MIIISARPNHGSRQLVTMIIHFARTFKFAKVSSILDFLKFLELNHCLILFD